MRMKKLSLFLLCLAAVCTATAQVTTSSIHGTVTDSDRNPIVGATVVATHTPTGTVYAAATSRNGMYNLGGMRVGGPYVIEISYVGSNSERFDDVYLTIGEDAQFNARLNESATAIGEVVVMGSANPVFNSNRTGAQEVITRSMMEKLPTLDRSLDEFVKLTPMASNKNFAGTSYRFNNVTVDGASFNNSFGLSSALGAAGIEPISLESIEQVQVMIAPFDVRNGGFTGGAINSVTKSGTNDFVGSAYFYHKGASLRGWRQGDLIETVNEAATNQFGFSLGGPIVKNKLFFFVNAEFDRINDPKTYTTKNSRVKAEELNSLKDFLIDKFDYNPGSYDVTEVPTEANRITARLDWNINQKNTLSLKYYFLDSFSTSSPSTSGAPSNGRGPNEWAIPFSSQYYRSNSDFHIVMADLNTTVNDRMSNTLKVGYSRLRDFRDMDGGFFPHVDILDGDGKAYTSFGTEANSYGNKLDTDIFQIQDNFTINAGKHQIVVGTQSDYRAFTNGYAYGFAGVWRYNSLTDFYADANAYLDWKAAGADPATRPVSNSLSKFFTQKYAIGGGFPEARTEVLQLGFYVQDRWAIRENFKLTYGVRVDVPIFLNDLDRNEEVEGMTFQGGIKNVDMSKLPKTKPMFSPRVGFNWDVMNNGILQLRGGTGLFTGTPPYVWISNQAGNNGLMFGDLIHGRPFDGIAEYQPNKDEVKTSRLDLAYTEKGFKYPQLWKTNVAVDFKFGNGWILTGEVLYTKDVNAIYHANVGLNDRIAYVNDGDGKTRPFYADENGDSYITERNGNVIEMRNTSKGYSIFGTVQLQKQFLDGALRGLYLNASYTMGKSTSVADGSSSVASSAWKYRPAIDCNSPEVSYSAGSFDGRLLLSAFYTANWSKNAATNFGLVYEMYRPWRYSFTYNGDVNGDGQYANDLIYIPRNKNEIQLEAGKYANADEAWNALDKFIRQDDYLSEHRGEYAERNGSVLPFEHQLNLSISHDIKIWCCKGRKCNTLRFSFDISNFLNLLNKDWGVKNTTKLGYQSSPQYQFLKVVDKPSAANNYTPTFTFEKDPENPEKALSRTYKDLRSDSSRWAIMFGVKYMFN